LVHGLLIFRHRAGDCQQERQREENIAQVTSTYAGYFFPAAWQNDGVPGLRRAFQRYDLVPGAPGILLRDLRRKTVGLRIHPGMYPDNCVCRFQSFHHALF